MTANDQQSAGSTTSTTLVAAAAENVSNDPLIEMIDQPIFYVIFGCILGCILYGCLFLVYLRYQNRKIDTQVTVTNVNDPQKINISDRNGDFLQNQSRMPFQNVHS